MLRIGDGSNLKEEILGCPREHRGDGELGGPLEKEGPLDDNCQWLWYPRQRGAHAFTIFHCMF